MRCELTRPLAAAKREYTEWFKPNWASLAPEEKKKFFELTPQNSQLHILAITQIHMLKVKIDFVMVNPYNKFRAFNVQTDLKLDSYLFVGAPNFEFATDHLPTRAEFVFYNTPMDKNEFMHGLITPLEMPSEYEKIYTSLTADEDIKTIGDPISYWGTSPSVQKMRSLNCI